MTSLIKRRNTQLYCIFSRTFLSVFHEVKIYSVTYLNMVSLIDIIAGICFTLSLLIQVSFSDIICHSVANEKWIGGLQGQSDFKKYSKICISNEDVILRYYACLIDGVILNNERLNKVYPNLKVIYWQCQGYCKISTKVSSLHVYGCEQS